MTTNHIVRPASLLFALAMATLSACGGGADAADTDATSVAESPDSAADGSPDTSPVTIAQAAPETDATAAPTTQAPTIAEAPSATEAPIEAPMDDAATDVELTPELAAFAEANGQLVRDWSAQLNAFGEEAIDHLDDVSQAPAAADAADLSAQVVAAIDPDTTDAGLLTLFSFADGLATAFDHAVEGDHDSALSVFLGLQTQSDTLSAVLDHFDA